MTGDAPPPPVPPAAPGVAPRTSRRAPWQAAARLARRDVRRRPGRTALVGVMIGLPVATLAAATILLPAFNLGPTEDRIQSYGQADAVATWQGTSSGLPAASPSPGPVDESLSPPPVLTDDQAMAELRAAYPDAESITVFAEGPDAIAFGGVLHEVGVSDAPVADPVFDGRVAMVDGRPPERPGEAAVSGAVLDDFGVRVGDRVDLLLAGTVEVTGTIRSASDHDARLVVTASPPAEHPAVVQWAYVTLPGVDDPVTGPAEPADPARLQAAGIEWLPFADYAMHHSRVEVGALYVLAGVALLMVAIVASAGFAVGARRQLRLLGTVAAAGGSPADLRRSVLLQGTVTGLVSSLIGLAVAVVGTTAVHPVLDDLLQRDVPPLTYPVALLVLAVALGTLAATAAAWLPARTAASVPTLSALAGRRPQPRLPTLVPVAGVVAIAAGIATLGAWSREAGRPWGLGLAAGVTVVLGATALAPLVVSWAEPLAGHLRRGRRLAARGLARQRLRSGAVVAAIMAPAGLTVLLACALVTDSARAERAWRDSAGGQFAVPHNEVLYLQEGASAEDAERTLGTIRRIVPNAQEQPVLAAVSTIGPPKVGYDAAVRVAGPGFIRYVIVVEEPDSLVDAGADQASADAVEAGRVLLPASGSRLPLDGPVALEGADAALSPDDLVVDHEVRLPRGDVIALVSRETAERWGADIVRIGSRFIDGRSLDDRQVERLWALGAPDDDEWLRRYLTQPGATTTSTGMVEVATPRSAYDDDSLPGRLAAVGTSALLTLAIVAVALALTAAESSDESRLLEAIGSPPSIRRSVSAWQATLLPAIAVAVAVPIALAVAAVLYDDASTIGPDHVVVPWLTVLGLAVALPLVSGGATWLGATLTGRGRRDLAQAVVGGD